MSETQHEQNEIKTDAKTGKSAPVIHRVCTTCNNMFIVTPDKVDVKICPACHKG
jgi:hypothetical protein